MDTHLFRQRTHKGSVESIGPLLDMTLWAADEGFVEASLPMVLVAELFESQTLAATEQSFLLLEQRAERIAALCRAPGRTTKVRVIPLHCYADVRGHCDADNRTAHSTPPHGRSPEAPVEDEQRRV